MFTGIIESLGEIIVIVKENADFASFNLFVKKNSSLKNQTFLD